jgi:hypothetical protein
MFIDQPRRPPQTAASVLKSVMQYFRSLPAETIDAMSDVAALHKSAELPGITVHDDQWNSGDRGNRSVNGVYGPEVPMSGGGAPPMVNEYSDESKGTSPPSSFIAELDRKIGEIGKAVAGLSDVVNLLVQYTTGKSSSIPGKSAGKAPRFPESESPGAQHEKMRGKSNDNTADSDDDDDEEAAAKGFGVVNMSVKDMMGRLAGASRGGPMVMPPNFQVIKADREAEIDKAIENSNGTIAELIEIQAMLQRADAIAKGQMPASVNRRFVFTDPTLRRIAESLEN